MNYKEIEILLEKYFDGESSLAEENLLKHYFLNNKRTHKEFDYAKAMFVQFKQEKGIQYSSKSKGRTLFLRIATVAASIALIAVIAFNQIETSPKIIYCYIDGKAITDKKIAINEVQSALNLVSRNLNRGTKELDQLSKFYESTLLITKE